MFGQLGLIKRSQISTLNFIKNFKYVASLGMCVPCFCLIALTQLHFKEGMDLQWFLNWAFHVDGGRIKVSMTKPETPKWMWWKWKSLKMHGIFFSITWFTFHLSSLILKQLCLFKLFYWELEVIEWNFGILMKI